MLKAIFRQLSALFGKTEINAAQAWQAANGEAKHPYWLFAPPVHMVLGRDTVFMGDPAPAVVTQEESNALLESLNQHFSEDGYHFYLLAGVWFLGLNHNPDITTVAVDVVKNKEVADYLPQGAGASAWMKIHTEIQMLLFSHPVNQAREAQGLPAINGLWCYGLGEAVA